MAKAVMMAQIQYFPNKAVMGNYRKQSNKHVLSQDISTLRGHSDRCGNHNAEATNVHKLRSEH